MVNPTPSLVRPGSDSLAFYTTRLLTSPKGNLTILRSAPGDDGPANLVATIFDPISEKWSEDLALHPESSESHAPSGFYSAGGVLHLAYLSTQIVSTNKTVTLDGVMTTIPNIPSDGRTDLKLIDVCTTWANVCGGKRRAVRK